MRPLPLAAFRRRILSLGALAAGASIVLSSSEATADPCAIELRGVDLPPAWDESLRQLRNELENRPGIDRCARIEVSRTPTGARVDIVLEDGRSTSRRVAASAELPVVVLSLVIVPSDGLDSTSKEDRASAGAKAAASASSDPKRAWPSPPAVLLAAPAEAAPRLATPDRLPRPASNAGAPLRFDVAASGGARFSGKPGVGAGGAAEVTVGHWIIGVAGRWESTGGASSSARTPAYSVTTVDLGVELGRRFEFGRKVALALVGDASIASVAQDALAPNNAQPLRNARVARVGAAARLDVRDGSTLQPFVAADASLDVATDSANNLPVSSALLPTWSAGMALGLQAQIWP